MPMQKIHLEKKGANQRFSEITIYKERISKLFSLKTDVS